MRYSWIGLAARVCGNFIASDEYQGVLDTFDWAPPSTATLDFFQTENDERNIFDWKSMLMKSSHNLELEESKKLMSKQICR